MFRNYFKTAWRSLLKNKAYSALNILGLAIGMAVALIIGLWVYDQYYRITINPVVFVIAGIAAIGITFITISFQAIKAAIANPVKSLSTDR